LGGNPAAAHRGAGPEELLIHPADVIGIFSKQAVGDLFRVSVLGWSAGPFGVAEADSTVAGLGGHLGEQQNDLGHRLLPSGEHLGVTDRRVERQRQGRQLDVADAIGGRFTP
jgi:hypothetical protein